MIADQVRVEAYAHALRKTVKPGNVVLDIGTGPGIFAVLACKLGARRVYAVEPDEIIQVGREVAAANGCADRIVFIEEMSTAINLPEKADVIVSDLRGVLPLFQVHIPSIIDARARFLAPAGVLIPRKDTIWAAVVDASETYRGIVDPWENNCLGQDLSPARRLVVNEFAKRRVEPGQMLAAPQQFAVLDYQTIESPDVQRELQWTIERAGTGHGIIAWFDAELTDNIGFSNAPGASEKIYGSCFFPWPQPVPLSAGQIVRVNLEARLVENNYVWRRRTSIESCERPGEIVAHFDQSELDAVVMSPAKLRKAASDHIPQLSEDGMLDRRILELMDGQATLEEIARRLADEFPKKFPRWQAAMSCVGAVSRKYGR